MRTTIFIDDRLAEKVRAHAAVAGESVSAFVADLLIDALARSDSPQWQAPFRLRTVRDEGVAPEINLDRPLTLETKGDHLPPAFPASSSAGSAGRNPAVGLARTSSVEVSLFRVRFIRYLTKRPDPTKILEAPKFWARLSWTQHNLPP